MKPPKIQATALFAAIIFALCCLGMFWEITHVLQARLDGPSFSTDEMLASLGVMVTGLGLFIAIATAGIAVLAIFGITELRAVAERKAQEGIEKIQTVLREKGLLDEEDVYRIQRVEVMPENHSASTTGVQESVSHPGTAAKGNAGVADKELSEYPEGKEEK
jgi:hypothetical protein